MRTDDIDEFILSAEDQVDLRPAESEYESEFTKAKTFLQKQSANSGDNLYDHLTEVLNKILAERPENIVDFFEEYSRKIKEKRFRNLTDHLEDIYVAPARFELAKKYEPLLKSPVADEPSTIDPNDLDIADMSKNDMLQLLYYFEHVGIGLPRPEVFAIVISMRNLVKQAPINSVRFWGKIYGIYHNYLVLEAEFTDEEILRRTEAEDKLAQEQTASAEAKEGENDAQEAAKRKALETISEEQKIGAEDDGAPSHDGARVSKVPRPLAPMPKSSVEELPAPPDEPTGTGANKKVFYVCRAAGDPWFELPSVRTAEIRMARLIYFSFTGNLDEEIVCYPAFPGTERNYLRAQIARISAGSQISPLGFYTFRIGGGAAEQEEEEEEEEEEEDDDDRGGAIKSTYRENPRYEPVPINDLVDGSLSFWVHHTRYILPQGRTSWWNPNRSAGELDEGGGAEEQEEEQEEDEAEGGKTGKVPGVEPETGPPLLTPLSEDASLEAMPPWSARLSSEVLPEFAVAVVRSNLWPGAYCFSSRGKLFQNVYLGNGLKHIAHNFTPRPLPDVQQDYIIGPEIMEMPDPKGALEEEWRIAHLPKPPTTMEDQEEEQEEEDDEEEAEEDED